jgi:hypothetical protein
MAFGYNSKGRFTNRPMYAPVARGILRAPVRTTDMVQIRQCRQATLRRFAPAPFKGSPADAAENGSTAAQPMVESYKMTN